MGAKCRGNTSTTRQSDEARATSAEGGHHESTRWRSVVEAAQDTHPKEEAEKRFCENVKQNVY